MVLGLGFGHLTYLAPTASVKRLTQGLCGSIRITVMIPVPLGVYIFSSCFPAICTGSCAPGALCRGGMKESGIGRENGLEAYESCMCLDPRSFFRCVVSQVLQNAVLDSQSKSIIVNIASAESTRVTDDWFADEQEIDRRYG